MSKTKSKPKPRYADPIDEAFAKLPTIKLPDEKMPDEIAGLFNTLVRMGESYVDRDQRDREYLDRQAEANQQLEALAVELDYNREFWKKHHRYPRGRERYPGPEPERKTEKPKTRKVKLAGVKTP